MKRYWNKFLNWLLPNRRQRLLAEIMKRDQELGIYDETLCCICEKEKADTGYDMMFCKDCWDEKW